MTFKNCTFVAHSFMLELYYILSVWVASGLLLAFGLMFLFMVVPDSPLLGNYRKARYTMAYAYLFFAVVGVAEYVFCDITDDDVYVLQAVTLIIAVSQAFLFTCTLLALLTVEFPGWRYVFRKAIPAIVLITAVFAVYIFCPEPFFTMAFYGFTTFYALLLAFYIRLFLAGYRMFRTKMDNYFSDGEADRLRWVAFSFFAALVVGVMALLSVVYVSTLNATIFAVVFNVFYLWFAIRFMNYAMRFHTIENAMDDKTENEILPIDRQTVDENCQISKSSIFLILDKKIEQWTAQKKFTEKGITIVMLSDFFETNRCYLSSYINTCKKKTFYEWIAELRVEEAKKLMKQYPDMSVRKIAEKVGCTNESHLIRQFTKLNGVSPTVWKKNSFN